MSSNDAEIQPLPLVEVSVLTAMPLPHQADSSPQEVQTKVPDVKSGVRLNPDAPPVSMSLCETACTPDSPAAASQVFQERHSSHARCHQWTADETQLHCSREPIQSQ